MRPFPLPVVEIFTSIQGEGHFMGKPATFIRFAGCNLRCPWCDTKNSHNVSDKFFYSVSSIMEKVRPDVELVVLTGGEPTLNDLSVLISELKTAGHIVAIETNGTKPIPSDWLLDWVTVSPKAEANYICRVIGDEFKYVVDDQFGLDCIAVNVLLSGKTIWFQPESHKKESMRKAYELVMQAENFNARVGIQLHKVLEVE